MFDLSPQPQGNLKRLKVQLNIAFNTWGESVPQEDEFFEEEKPSGDWVLWRLHLLRDLQPPKYIDSSITWPLSGSPFQEGSALLEFLIQRCFLSQVLALYGKKSLSARLCVSVFVCGYLVLFINLYLCNSCVCDSMTLRVHLCMYFYK